MLYFDYNQIAYYLYNGHADVVALIDGSGNTLATYYYDAFGNITEQTGNIDNNITYAGYQYDKETNTYYLMSRMYDPVTARFMQEDTYRGNVNDPLSLNLYTYCVNNPLIYEDPTGHMFEGISKWYNEKKKEVEQGWEDYKRDWKAGADMIVNHPKEAIQLVKSEIPSSSIIAEKALKTYIKIGIKTQPVNDFVTSLGNHLGVRSIIPNPFYNSNSNASNAGKALGDTISIGMLIKGVVNAIMPKSPSVVTDTGIVFDESTLGNQATTDANMINKASSSTGVEGAAKTGYKLKPDVDLDLRGTGKTYQDALDDAFKRTEVPKEDFEVTKWGKDANGKSFPVEWRAKNGAEVNIDMGHTTNGPDAPHVGYQTGGKRGSGGAVRGHILVDDVPINR